MSYWDKISLSIYIRWSWSIIEGSIYPIDKKTSNTFLPSFSHLLLLIILRCCWSPVVQRRQSFRVVRLAILVVRSDGTPRGRVGFWVSRNLVGISCAPHSCILLIALIAGATRWSVHVQTLLGKNWLKVNLVDFWPVYNEWSSSLLVCGLISINIGLEESELELLLV